VTFISYAGNLEDVLLHRALADVSEGRWVDVGAADPLISSVTKAFSDLGWSGVNVEPNPRFAARLAAERPRDVTLQVACSDEPGEARLIEPVGFPELATLDASVAAAQTAQGQPVLEYTVPVRTLADIVAEHVEGEVHFLKIDVEGAEAAVLRGTDLQVFRPWIILAEEIVLRVGASSTEVRELLEEQGYVSVWFDGLNRFYVAAERHERLAPAFQTPVNVTDDYRVAARERAEFALARIAGIVGLGPEAPAEEIIERAAALLADRIAFETALQTERAFEVELDAWEQQSFERERFIAWQAGEIARARAAASSSAEAEHWRAELERVLATRSWRITRPLRVLRRPGHYLRNR